MHGPGQRWSISARELHPGSVFAGFRIERKLGAGGMGSVYLAAHPSLPRLVALKLPDPALTRDPEGRDRFLREADHAARLDHPNIVTVYDRGAERDPGSRAERDPGSRAERGERPTAGRDEQLWISMQYVDGTDAATPLRHGPMAPARAVAIVGDIARALDHAHTHGVLHRDVKPANILLTRPRPGDPERALLADFGIAKSLEFAALTRTGTVVASLQYASPEQLEGRPLDGRSDQYALGCTLFHLLTGQPPFPGSDTAYLVHAHLHLPAPRVTTVRPDLPPALDAVIARALAKDPGQRFPSSSALAAAAHDAVTGGPTVAVTPPLTPTPAATLATSLPGTAAATPAAPATRPRRLLVPVAAGAAVAALAAAGATAWLLRDHGSDVASASPATAGAVSTVSASAAPTHTETVLVPAPATTPTATGTPATTTRKVPPGQAASSAAADAPTEFVGFVDGADEQGFTDGSGPRCNYTNPAVVVARTEESAIVICRTGAGRYYYMGSRDSDGSEIEIDDPKPSGDGFTVTNRSVKYTLDSETLTITDRGELLAREPVLEYRSSGR